MKAPIDAVTWVAAFDGGKAVIWRNEGFDDQPNLKMVETLEIENPPDREQGVDRPGRMPDPKLGRSAMSETDFHKQAKERFVERIVDRLNEAATDKAFDRILLMAPAAALGDARPHYSDDLKARLVEYPGDYVHEPMERIDKRVTEALTAKAG